MTASYFNDLQSWKKYYYIRGLTSDDFYTDGGLRLNIEEMIFQELRQSGYEKIIFYSLDRGFYCYDETSFSFLSRKPGNEENTPQEEKKESTAQKAKKYNLSGGKRIHRKQASDESTSTQEKAVRTDSHDSASSGKKKQSTPKKGSWKKGSRSGVDVMRCTSPRLFRTVNAELAKDEISASMNDSSVKTAYVVRNAETFRISQEGQSFLDELTRNYEITDTMKNRNIVVFIYPDNNLIHLFESPEEEEQNKNGNVIQIAQPNQAEYQNLLMYLRRNRNLKFRIRELEDLSAGLEQAVQRYHTSNHKIMRINELSERLASFAAVHPNHTFSKEDCFSLLNVEQPKESGEALNKMVGLPAFKQFMKALPSGKKKKEREDSSRFHEKEKENHPDLPSHLALMGNPGAGKEEAVRVLAVRLHEQGFLASDEPWITQTSRLVSPNIGETPRTVAAEVQNALGRILYIPDTASLRPEKDASISHNRDAIHALASEMERHKGELLVVLGGTEQDLNAILEVDSRLSGYFRKISFEDFTSDEMKQIFEQKAEQRDCQFSEELAGQLDNFCENWVRQADETWSNGDEADRLLNAMMQAWQQDQNRKQTQNEDGRVLRILEANHLPDVYLDYLTPAEEMRERALKELDQLTGLSGVKETVASIRRNILTGQMTQAENYVFTGNPGTGKTTVARLMGTILRDLKILKRGHTVEVTARKLIADVQANHGDFDKIADKALGGILFIDEAHQLVTSAGGQAVLDSLVTFTENNHGNVCVILAGYPRQIEDMLAYDPGLQGRFPRKIHFDDYSGEELTSVLKSMLAAQGYDWDEDFEEYSLRALTRIVQNLRPDQDFSNARFIRDEYIRDCREALSIRLHEQYGENIPKQVIRMLTGEDIPAQYRRYIRSPLLKDRSALEEINSLIGFDELKSALRDLLELKHRADELNEPEMLEGLNLHWIITGNPGTGKTMVSKLIGKVYHEMGLLKYGTTHKVTRSDLVGNVIGDTEKKTAEWLKKAQGGVLFIDEAYSLVTEGTSGDFGMQAINTILEQMSDKNGSFSVVAAGYPLEMQTFLNANPGFPSRFGNKIELKDYTAPELVQIFERKCRAQNTEIDDSLSAVLTDLFENKINEGRSDWANGREAENLEKNMRSTWAKNPKWRTDPETGMQTKLYTAEHIPPKDQKYLEAQKKKSAWEQMDELIGYEPIKEELRQLKEFSEYNKTHPDGKITLPERLHWVLEGNPGTGKTSIAKLIAQVYKECGILPSGACHETTGSNLVAPYSGQTGPKVQRIVHQAMGGVLFIDEAYSLTDKGSDAFGQQAVTELVAQMEKHNGEFAVVCAGYPDKMEEFLQSNQGLSSRMKKFVLEDYTPKELAQILELKCRSEDFILEDSLKEKLELFFYNKKNLESKIRDWGNGREAENLFRSMVHLWIRNERVQADEEENEIRILSAEHIPGDQQQYLKGQLPKKEKQKSAFEEIDELIGYEPIKKTLKELISRAEYNREHPDEEIKTAPQLHWVLEGNAGTGKTSIASLIAKVYKECGILPRGIFKETTGTDLVGQYMGQTGPKVRELVKQSMGGVLFIDEAYSLTDSEQNSYGKEAVTELVKATDQFKGEFSLICAGYPERMERFLKSNPGLSSRMVTFYLDDYTAAELVQILDLKCSGEKFVLEEDLHSRMEHFFERKKAAESKNRDWGNGREVVNLLNAMINLWLSNQTTRTEEDGKTVRILTAQHIPSEQQQYLEQEA